MLINLFELKLFIYVFSSMQLCEFNVYEFIKLKLYNYFTRRIYVHFMFMNLLN